MQPVSFERQVMQQYRSVQGQAAMKIAFRRLNVRRTKQDFDSRLLNHIFHNSRRKGARRLPLPLRHKERNGVVPRATTIELLFLRGKNKHASERSIVQRFHLLSSSDNVLRTVILP